jgi:poly(hydroxyalkanoate) depolymerase family esterase
VNPRRRSRARRAVPLWDRLLRGLPKRRRVTAPPRVRPKPPPALPRPRIPVPRRRPGTWVAGPPAPLGGRSYDVYLPAGYRTRTRAPLVVLLHGCMQTPAEFAEATRFTSVADRNGLLLVLPHQDSRHHPQRCWRWYEARNQRRDAGEPGILAGITAQVLAETGRWRADPARVYAAGLSAGGAMALALAAAYPDVFAAVGVHSAPPYRSAVNGAQALAAMAARTVVPTPPAGAPAMAPVVVLQGSADTVVRPANGPRDADQWLAYRAAAPATPPVALQRTRVDDGRSTDGRHWTRTRWYTARGQRVLELWRIDDLAHAWSGGRPGGSYSDPAGPRAATVMWNFFRAHRG